MPMILKKTFVKTQLESNHCVVPTKAIQTQQGCGNTKIDYF
jgi:hypothetical protein